MNPYWGILMFFWGILLLLIVRLTYRMTDIQRDHKHASEITGDTTLDQRLDRFALSKGFLYSGIVALFVLMLFTFYMMIRGTPWVGHLQEWLNLIIRWLHITFGIAWIGTSFYFVFLENALNRKKDVRDELAGNLWAIHGGGFYYLEKYKLAPRVIPKELHWFKYEAYFTWISGFSLLAVVYYFDARAFLIDPGVLDITPAWGIAISIISLIIGWGIYDFLCKTPLIRKSLLFPFAGFLLATAFAIFFTEVFSARAAYIHFGALLGSIMAANVFFVIIPSQKAMVRAAKEGLSPDPVLGQNAGLRSLHNNYLTLPVLFVMISNHFPTTFGHEHPWLILIALTLASAGIKHYLNLREKGQQSVWVMPISILMILAVAFITAPQPRGGECNSKVTITEILNIVNDRCITCHSSRPTDETWTSPPNGVVYDTPQDIFIMKDKILQRVYYTETMPQNNKTGMTPEERDAFRCWIEQGAPIE